ncbi:peptide-N-glycosidase F-related protein [Fulvivirgaceae bacterium BMA10]|uniref:Peptide-N-glycosidase F-related protein n=1 Tax=Splendidivirga corallicola TaxID=3051826 RepID=A0ABT8KXB4_9BACT|nr:peptide-N-glycosidase F-related protein [Fulvivirgaceae bacterium BMA10]
MNNQKVIKKQLSLILTAFLFCTTNMVLGYQQQDTTVVQVFTFDDPSPEGWGASYKGKAKFPTTDKQWGKILMIQRLKCDERTKGDKFPCGEWDYFTNTVIKVPKGDTVEAFEIGSFITPYGKRLELGGEEGWRWVYDLTDYAPILKGELEISSGNNLELLDLKFLFIEGIPDRDVLSVENIYPIGDYNYGKLADDSVLQSKKMVLNADANAYKLKARISGHGHYGPRNCCEWDSKVHSYFINRRRMFNWNVWKDCGYNPIFPQGGTWQFNRAGWCPGTKVDEHDFELSNWVEPGDTVMIDYAIEPYADNGEKGGDFRMSHQLISYGSPNFKNDASIHDIIAPSEEDTYGRENPTCGDASIVIKNAGSHQLRSLEIHYGLRNGKKSVYQWRGNLTFLEKEEVWLPAPEWKDIDTDNVFEVVVKNPNGQKDERASNNRLTSKVLPVPILPNQFQLKIDAVGLGRAKENGYFLSNNSGKVLFYREELADNQVYEDMIKLDNGCYELLITDKHEDGMIRHWWNRGRNPDLVGENGNIQILDKKGTVLHTLKYDFADKLIFRFRVK